MKYLTKERITFLQKRLNRKYGGMLDGKSKPHHNYV